MLMPKRVKYRKRQKGRMRGVAYRGGSIDFGTYGLQALECGRISNRQIEAARIAMTRHIKRGGKIWLRIPKSHWKQEWVRARATRSSGWLSSSRAECFMKWRV